MLLANKTVAGLQVNYTRLLAGLFDVVADFFSRQNAGDNEEKRLVEWFPYNQQSGDDLVMRVRDSMKQIAQNLPGASAVFTRKLEKLQTSTSFISNPDLKLLLAFDEAPALIEMETSHVQKTILLSRALSILPYPVQRLQLNFKAGLTSKRKNRATRLHPSSLNAALSSCMAWTASHASHPTFAALWKSYWLPALMSGNTHMTSTSDALWRPHALLSIALVKRAPRRLKKRFELDEDLDVPDPNEGTGAIYRALLNAMCKMPRPDLVLDRLLSSLTAHCPTTTTKLDPQTS
ncbi:hypothetical protein PCANC_02060 [Puccinia coronata f. sp. avenae]|uniref:Uncharacterized protein n=1 Tax=Puccinia coronata f. sp. avenae TaxID=200324 RepID=A0A2N5W1W7_9BASI|nr:hypothetical protein PCANC_02060 [Puccinia coronata f. sp. avenae]